MNLDLTKITVLFGGTFDPLHLGHFGLVRHLHEAGLVAQSIFMPAGRPPHKLHRQISDDHHRLEMLRRATATFPEMFVSDHEIEQGGVSYTINTAREFSARLGDNLRLLIGADSLRELHTWYAADELTANYRFIVYRRPQYPIPSEAELANRFSPEVAHKLTASVVDAPEFDLSSTEIRQRIQAGKDVSPFLLPAVRDYIIENGLYREDL